jgi:hypothetical protein
MSNDFKLPTEWLKQAEYDMDTARAMFKTGLLQCLKEKLK